MNSSFTHDHGSVIILPPLVNGKMEDTLALFHTFLTRVGAQIDTKAISIVKSDVHRYGITALSAIPTGHIIARIPKTAILSLHTASLWQNSNTATHTDDLCPRIFQLPAALLFERLLAHKSPWFHYINTLPRTLADIATPLTYTPSEISAACMGTGVELLSANMREQLTAVFEQTVRHIIARRAREMGLAEDRVACMRVQEFMWAYACVSSRAFFVGGLHGDAMVPVADMFNAVMEAEHIHIEGTANDGGSGSDDDSDDDSDDHSDDHRDDHRDGVEECVKKEKTDDDMCDKHLTIRCVRDVNAGDEIFNTFGHKPNTVLFLNYGFTASDNPHDTAFLHKRDIHRVLAHFSEIVADADRQMTPERQSIIQAAEAVIYDEVIDHFFQIKPQNPPFSHGLLVLIYLHIVPWSLISHFSEDEIDLLHHVIQLSPTTVLNAGREHVEAIVESIAETKRHAFPSGTTLASDERLLGADGDMSPLALHALRIRVGQRKALRDACDNLLAFENENGMCDGEDTVESDVDSDTGERECKRAKTG